MDNLPLTIMAVKGIQLELNSSRSRSDQYGRRIHPTNFRIRGDILSREE